MREYIIRQPDHVDSSLSLEPLFVGEIVRCRDCVHLEMQKVRYSSKPIFVCIAEWCEGSEGDNPLVNPDGFCAWGERKEGGDGLDAS